MQHMNRFSWRYLLCLAACVLAWSGCASIDSIEPANDAEIASDVRARLADDVTVGRYLIGVQVQDGVVELTGTVRPAGDRARAVAIARGTGGVRGVVDRTTD